jgi:hypothetical protein
MLPKFTDSNELIITLLPSIFIWVAIFLLIARKKRAALVAIGIAVAGYSIKTAGNAFNAGELGPAAAWTAITIATLIGVTLILKQPVGSSAKSESE